MSKCCAGPCDSAITQEATCPHFQECKRAQSTCEPQFAPRASRMITRTYVQQVLQLYMWHNAVKAAGQREAQAVRGGRSAKANGSLYCASTSSSNPICPFASLSTCSKAARIHASERVAVPRWRVSLLTICLNSAKSTCARYRASSDDQNAGSRESENEVRTRKPRQRKESSSAWIQESERVHVCVGCGSRG